MAANTRALQAPLCLLRGSRSSNPPSCPEWVGAQPSPLTEQSADEGLRDSPRSHGRQGRGAVLGVAP